MDLFTTSLETKNILHKDGVVKNNELNNLEVRCKSCVSDRSIAKCKATLRKKSKKYTHDGLTMTVKEWASLLGITEQSIVWRLEHWSLSDVFSKERGIYGPLKKQKD